MAINLNNNDISNIQYGNNKVTAVYKGSTKIWPVAEKYEWRDTGNYYWVNNGSLTCQTSTSVSGFSGYYAATGNSSQPQAMYRYQQKYIIYNDGTSEAVEEYRYAKYDLSSTISSIASQGAASSTSTTRIYNTANSGCLNYEMFDNNWTCDVTGSGINERNNGTATKGGVWRRYITPNGSTLLITQFEDGTGTPKGTSQTVTASGCIVNEKYQVISTTCSTGTVNPSTKGFDLNQNVNGLNTGNKVTNYSIANSVCNISDYTVVASYKIVPGASTSESGLDTVTCKFSENITANTCVVNTTSNDYTGQASKSYKYTNIGGDTAGSTVNVNNILSNANTSSTPISNCPVFNGYINGGPTGNISFNGNSYSLTISAARAFKIVTSLGTLSNTTGNANQEITSTLTVPAQTTSGSNVVDRQITITLSPNDAGISTPKVIKTFTQEGCTSTIETHNIDVPPITCQTNGLTSSFPSNTTGLVNASGLAISGTLGAGGVSTPVSGLNSGNASVNQKEQQRTICTAIIAGMVYNSGWSDTTKVIPPRVYTSSLCDNRVVSPSMVTNYTCLTSGGSNTGQVQKVLGIYRAPEPNSSLAYSQAGISPQSINYVYTDESKCPVKPPFYSVPFYYTLLYDTSNAPGNEDKIVPEIRSELIGIGGDGDKFKIFNYYDYSYNYTPLYIFDTTVINSNNENIRVPRGVFHIINIEHLYNINIPNDIHSTNTQPYPNYIKTNIFGFGLAPGEIPDRDRLSYLYFATIGQCNEFMGYNKYIGTSFTFTLNDDSQEYINMIEAVNPTFEKIPTTEIGSNMLDFSNLSMVDFNYKYNFTFNQVKKIHCIQTLYLM